MDNKSAFVYIMTNKKNGTLYVGVTNDILRRVYEHKNALVSGFTKKYRLDKLVYFEMGNDIQEAIVFEKKIKNRSRQFKINLIEKGNPLWRDLSKDFLNTT